jgi:hypothetical protein
MCHHNFVQHNGCGHIGEAHTEPWTLCSTAVARLDTVRSPFAQPLSPPSSPPPKRTASTRRFLSLSRTLSRSSTHPSAPGSPRSSMGGDYFSAVAPPIDYSSIPEHQIAAARCEAPTKRTRISSEMNVCKECLRGIADMRSLVQRYDKTGCVKGTAAFEEFLKWRGEGLGDAEGDLTVPVEDSIYGVPLGAREAIILGHPEGKW